jgi:hypothetical protein
MLLLSEGQAGEAWESSEKQWFFRNQRALDRNVNVLSLQLVFKEREQTEIHSMMKDLMLHSKSARM